jgi:hypothetical protein
MSEASKEWERLEAQQERSKKLPFAHAKKKKKVG